MMELLVVLVGSLLTFQHCYAEGTTYYNEELNKTYILESKSTQSSYSDAKIFCHQNGAQVIKLDTPTEVAWIHDNIMQSFFWLGVQEKQGQTPDHWLDGTPIKSEELNPRWRPHQEQNHRSQTSGCIGLIFDEYEGNFVRWNCGWRAFVLCHKYDPIMITTVDTATTRSPPATSTVPPTTEDYVVSSEEDSEPRREAKVAYTFRSSSKLYKASDQHLNFDDARHFCTEQNATLLRIASREEREFVAGNVAANDHIVWLAVKPEVGMAPTQWADGGAIHWDEEEMHSIFTASKACGVYATRWNEFSTFPCVLHAGVVCEVHVNVDEVQTTNALISANKVKRLTARFLRAINLIKLG